MSLRPSRRSGRGESPTLRCVRSAHRVGTNADPSTPFERRRSHSDVDTRTPRNDDPKSSARSDRSLARPRIEQSAWDVRAPLESQAGPDVRGSNRSSPEARCLPFGGRGWLKRSSHSKRPAHAELPISRTLVFVDASRISAHIDAGQGRCRAQMCAVSWLAMRARIGQSACSEWDESLGAQVAVSPPGRPGHRRSRGVEARLREQRQFVGSGTQKSQIHSCQKATVLEHV